jgi:uncharacterized phosphosugar-binding protein
MADAMTGGFEPTPAAEPSDVRRWLREARGILDEIEATQLAAIEEAAQLCAQVIGDGRVVHLFGTGHSRIPVEELFPRYGSFPGFSPIVELSMTNYASVVGPNGLRQAMFIERQSGLAAEILASCSLAAGDALMVFSFSGTTLVSVEVAEGARRLGLPVIVVTSVGPEPSQNRLARHADVVVDLCVPAGDALIEVHSGNRVGPGSTLAFVAVVNLIRVRTAQLLDEGDLLPPVIAHRSVVGDERSLASVAAAVEDQRRRLATAERASLPPLDARAEP